MHLCLETIIRYCHTPRHADILSIRGATVDTLIGRVKENILNFVNYWLIIIHIGTNDVDNGKALDILTKINQHCAEIRLRNPLIQFVISTILARPKDFPTTNPIIKNVNRSIAEWCR